MTRELDPEGSHLAALHRLTDFGGLRVLELGCGDGRLTVPVAADAEYVLAVDPDADSVERARAALPSDLADRIDYRVASGRAIEIERGAFDLALFSWSLWWVEREDVVHVLRHMVGAVRPGGLVLDLQVIRPNPVVETGGVALCEIDGEPLFRNADAATAAIDACIRGGQLREEAVDDHDVRKHYSSGAAVVDWYADDDRRLPEEAIPRVLAVTSPCAVRERCRLRKLRAQPFPHIPFVTQAT